MQEQGFVYLVQMTSTMGLTGSSFMAGLGHGLLFPSLIALMIRPIAAGDGQWGDLFSFPAIFTMAAATTFVGLAVFLRRRRMHG